MSRNAYLLTWAIEAETWGRYAPPERAWGATHLSTCSKDTWLLTSTAILRGSTCTTWCIHGAYGVFAGRLRVVPRCSPVPAMHHVGPHVVQEHTCHQRCCSGSHGDLATLCMVYIRSAAGLRLQFLLIRVKFLYSSGHSVANSSIRLS